MYKIIGADHREYGPVPAERIKEWILEGRANAQSRIRPEGGEWQALDGLTEFTDVLKAQAAAAPPPPRIASTEADRMASSLIARDYRVDIGDWFSRAWHLMQEDFWLLVGATAVILVLSFGIASVPVIGTVANLLLGFVLWGSLDWLFLKRIRGLRADMGDAFVGFSVAFVPLLLAGLVVQVLTAVGFLLCILPGIYLFVIWWGFVPLLIIDKRLDFWPAMELSRKVINQHWWQVALLMLCVMTVGLAGLLVFGVGIFLTLPLAEAVSVYAYEEIFGKLEPTALALAASNQPPVESGPVIPATPRAPTEGAVPPAESLPPVTGPIGSEVRPQDRSPDA